MARISRREFIKVSGLLGAGLATRPRRELVSEAGSSPAGGRFITAVNNLQAYAYAIVRPAGLSDTRITGGFLGAYVDRTREVSVLDFFAKLEKRGSFKNFPIVAGGLHKQQIGNSAEDAELYKMVEAAGLFASRSQAISNAFQPLIHDILTAQDRDGYPRTLRTGR